MFHKAMDAILRIDLDKQLDMIRHDLRFDHRHSAFLRYLVNDRFEPFIHVLYQDAAPILRAPDHVIFAGINHVVIGFVFHILITHRKVV